MKKVDFIKPIKNGRLSEFISEQIKDAIFNKKLIPGERLPSENEIAERFNTSRVTIREALRILELYGLLEVKKGKGGGTFVKNVDLKMVKNSLLNYLHFNELSVENIFEVRFILEPVTAELAAYRRNQDDLTEMKKIIDETDLFIKKVSTSNEKKFLMERSYENDLNVEFHRAVAKSSKNPILIATVESIVDLHNRELNLLKPTLKIKSLSLKGHKRIYEHILNQNGELAKKEMYIHLNGIKKIFIKMESRIKNRKALLVS